MSRLLKSTLLVSMGFLTACSSSSSATHTAEDYRTSTLTTSELEAYQDSYTGDSDWVISADGEVHFSDGSTEGNHIQIHFDGTVADVANECVFSIDDDRDLMQGLYDSSKLVRPCDGHTAADFKLGDVNVSIKGHTRNENGMAVFHIDNIVGPSILKYYSGHSPDESSQDDDQ